MDGWLCGVDSLQAIGGLSSEGD
jgi:hypothetical protein